MKKKKHKKRKALRIVLSVFAFLIASAAVAALLFRTRGIEIEGSSYYSENTITTWIQNDKLAANTLYVMIKYDLLDGDVPSGIERFDISLKNPWTLRVTVREKEAAGYVNDGDAYLYFDSTGTAVLKTKKLVDGVPCIEGMELDTTDVELGEKLPVEDEGIFGDIVDVSENLGKYGLAPDRLSCAGGEIRIYFGVVEVMLGNGGYEEKLRQVEPILAKLNELYPDTAGTLHLENYTSDSGAIRFVPAG